MFSTAPQHRVSPIWRELASRRDDGLDITLSWSPDSGALKVAVVDPRFGDGLQFEVPPTQALDAYRQPLAFASALRIPYCNVG